MAPKTNRRIAGKGVSNHLECGLGCGDILCVQRSKWIFTRRSVPSIEDMLLVPAGGISSGARHSRTDCALRSGGHRSVGSEPDPVLDKPPTKAKTAARHTDMSHLVCNVALVPVNMVSYTGGWVILRIGRKNMHSFYVLIGGNFL